MKNRGKNFNFRNKSSTKGQGGQTWLKPPSKFIQIQRNCGFWPKARKKPVLELIRDTNKSSQFTKNLTLLVVTAVSRRKAGNCPEPPLRGDAGHSAEPGFTRTTHGEGTRSRERDEQTSGEESVCVCAFGPFTMLQRRVSLLHL